MNRRNTGVSPGDLPVFRRCTMRAAVLLAAVCATGNPVWSVAASNAEILDAVNAIRMQGCDGQPGNATPLVEQPQLSEATRKSAGNMPHREALTASGYRPLWSALIRMRGVPGAKAIADVVAAKSCTHLIDATLKDIGIHQQDLQAWIILASPFSPPLAESAEAVAQRVVELVNETRSQQRLCGEKSLPAAPPVVLNATLSKVASTHASDMASKNYFAHQSPDGTTPPDRVTRGGYRWRSVGENIAAGQMTPEAAVQAWIKSPSHCGTLMGPQFTEMGVAFAVNRSSGAGIYWTQLFGRPR